LVDSFAWINGVAIVLCKRIPQPVDQVFHPVFAARNHCKSLIARATKGRQLIARFDPVEYQLT
jgi:hypothetical protein